MAAAEVLLRALIVQARAARSSEAKLFASLGEQVLAAEGLAPEAAPKVPKTGAERQADYRERRRLAVTAGASPPSPDPCAEVTKVTPVTSHVTVGGGGGSAPDLKISAEKEEIQERDQSARVTDVTPAESTASLSSRVTPGTPAASLSSLTLEPTEGKRSAKKGTRAPSSVDPGAGDFCRLHGLPPPEPGSECADFLDYWAARTRDATSLDWAARWRSRPDWTKRVNGRGHKHAVQPVPPDGFGWKVGGG